MSVVAIIQLMKETIPVGNVEPPTPKISAPPIMCVSKAIPPDFMIVSSAPKILIVNGALMVRMSVTKINASTAALVGTIIVPSGQP